MFLKKKPKVKLKSKNNGFLFLFYKKLRCKTIVKYYCKW